MQKKKTHMEKLIAHFKRKKTITTYEAFAKYGNTRLSAYIHKLVHKHGYIFQTNRDRKKDGTIIYTYTYLG
jgi:hypothetical protein